MQGAKPCYTLRVETPDEILKRMREKGSIALHVDHNWRRGEHWEGIWCEDCNLWVVRPEGNNGHQA